MLCKRTFWWFVHTSWYFLQQWIDGWTDRWGDVLLSYIHYENKLTYNLGKNDRICAYVRWTLFNCHNTPLLISSFLELSFTIGFWHLPCTRHLLSSRPEGELCILLLPQDSPIRRVILRNEEIGTNTGFIARRSGRVHRYCEKLVWEYENPFNKRHKIMYFSLFENINIDKKYNMV